MTGSVTLVGSSPSVEFCFGSSRERTRHLTGRHRRVGSTGNGCIGLLAGDSLFSTMFVRCYITGGVGVPGNVTVSAISGRARLSGFDAGRPTGFGGLYGSGSVAVGSLVRILVSHKRFVETVRGRGVAAPSNRFVNTGIGRTIA